MRRVLAVSVVALGCAHGTGSPDTHARPAVAKRTAAQICRGSDLDIDRAAKVCTVHDAPRPVPVTALRVEIVPSVIEIESGRERAIAVQMMNTTARPLALDLVLGCDAFEVSTYAEDGRTRVDLSSKVECQKEIPIDAACRSDDPVRVTLEPGGRLVKRLTLATQSHGLVRWRGACVPEEGMPLEPGRYVARVRLPFPAQPIAGAPDSAPSPSVEVPMEVTPMPMYPQAARP